MNTTKRALGITMLALTALVLLAVPVNAVGPPEPAGEMFQLTTTKYGAQVNAVGWVKIAEPEKGVETFAVVVLADVKDSKLYAVDVTTINGKFPYKVADVAMVMGVGTVQQCNLTHKTKAFPISELLTVVVRDRVGVIMTGSFPAFQPQG